VRRVEQELLDIAILWNKDSQSQEIERLEILRREDPDCKKDSFREMGLAITRRSIEAFRLNLKEYPIFEPVHNCDKPVECSADECGQSNLG